MTVHLKTAYVDLPMSVETILIGRFVWVKPQVEKPDPRPITRLFALVSLWQAHLLMNIAKCL